ncbi:MAG: hypothetical protein L6R38_005387 [Xanthoria sp. 2 TBL-2021]|nr:MAG: hypothetical protein L6R38_005387 [Xanthoria sp. 2 TBL-2021]
MWLERLSGQSMPSASSSVPNRSYSPAPRRSSHLAPNNNPRPSYGPRTSSLGLVSRANSSTTSLNSPQLANGSSSLRQEIAAPPDVVDPLDALGILLGKRKDKGGDGQEDRESVPLDHRPTDLDVDIDFQGQGLDAFVQDAGQGSIEESRRYANQTVEECEYVYPLEVSCLEYN